MRISALALASLACNGDTTYPYKDSGGGDADVDADADADADTDVDTDTDTDVEPPEPQTGVRVLHIAPGLPSQDMVVNGTKPPVLTDLRWQESTGYSERPAGTYTFQFVDAGAALDTAWTTFDFAMLNLRRHTLVVAGEPGATTVLAWVDDDLKIPPTDVRIRWTHAAPTYPDPVDFLETFSGAVLASDVGYLQSVELDHLPDSMQVGVDVDDDGIADLVFQDFQRSAGEYFHVVFSTDVTQVPFLLGQTARGDTPIRALLP